jgi:hypothetical protein
MGVALPAAYVRISRVSGDKTRANVLVEIYANEAARQANAQPVETCMHRLAMPSDVPLYPAIYGTLKLLPEYAGAVDC